MNDEQKKRVLEERKERVPICGARQITIPRCIWDEAWLAYGKKYGGSATDSQFYRLLNEGFYASELDDLRPGWRPVAQEIERLRNAAFDKENRNEPATVL